MYKSKEDKKIYERNWYKTIGKEKRKIANNRWKYKQRDEFQEFKKKLKCNRCPENHVACLEFHHLDPTLKDIEVGRAALRWSLKRLKEEIIKCEILCSNCHRKEHYKQRQASIEGDALVL
jgi:hypothetical protein